MDTRRRTLRLKKSDWAFGNAIGQRRLEMGLRQDQVAAAAGIKRPTYSQLESGARRTVSYATSGRIASALGLDHMTLWALSQEARILTKHLPSNAMVAPEPPLTQPLPYNIPIRVVKNMGLDLAMYITDTIADYAPRPVGIAHATNVEGFRMSGDSMLPAIRDGALLYWDAGRRCRVGDDVVLTLVNGGSLVRRLVSETDESLTVESFHPERTATMYRKSEIVRMLHILTLNELMGVS